MNPDEFKEQYNRLRDVHPLAYASQEKMQTVWKFVEEMDFPWFRSLVDRIIMANRHDNIDIGEAVSSERRSRTMKKFADDVTMEMDNRTDLSVNGLETVLEKYKIKSLSEAIGKS